MRNIISEIISLTATVFTNGVKSVLKLPVSGGNRQYFRVTFADSSQPSLIAAYGTDERENEAFLQWTTHFKKSGIHVPEILAVNSSRDLYLLEDLGSESLLHIKLCKGETEEVKQLYKNSLRELAHMQIAGEKGLNYSLAVISSEFDKVGILHDLLYFKFNFLDLTGIAYNRDRLMGELDVLAVSLSDSRYRYFMFRDFQGRNIHVRAGKVYFIDYQGGMKGPAVYDVASLLWQAKAALSKNWQDELFYFYTDCLALELGTEIDREILQQEFKHFSLLRLLQVLGAYGYRGLFQQKLHFISSIPEALHNLSLLIKQQPVDNKYPELRRIIDVITEKSFRARFEVKNGNNAPLTVHINSFSFIQRGYPADPSGNGGGFVFDCRGILNPGRLEEFKNLTGRDGAVKDFLETQTRMPEFLQRVFAVTDVTVENYLERGFNNLMISFGCTGGQHRSVYAADAMAKYLKDKYGVKTVVNHLEQKFKE